MSQHTEANRQHFDDEANGYDLKHSNISQQIAAALQERKKWTGVRWLKEGEIGGREVRMLDYACGTGSITKAVGPWVTQIKGIDISENMVWQFNQAAEQSGLKPEQVSARVGNLLGEEIPDSLKTEEYYNFDIAVVGLGFHHFENPVGAIERLTERLKPESGVLMIIDFLPFDAEGGNAEETIKQTGFTKKNMETLFKVAHLEKFSFSIVDEPAIMQMQGGTKQRKLFIARGNRQPTTAGKFWNWLGSMQDTAADQFAVKPRGDKIPSKLGLFGERSTGKSEW